MVARLLTNVAEPTLSDTYHARRQRGHGRHAAHASPESRLPSPYVLVGHSLGGLIVYLLARQSPSDVAAIVMLDATAAEDPAVMADYETIPQRIVRRTMGALFR